MPFKKRARIVVTNESGKLLTFFYWWGEGEAKVYLDGDDRWPTLVGTGAEDYVGSAWDQGLFVNAYQGNPYMSKKKGAWRFYRFHIPDPVYFHEDIRVDIQVMAGAKYSDILKAMDMAPGARFM